MGRGTEHCHERCRRKTQVCLNKSPRDYRDIGDPFLSIFIFYIFFIHEALVNIEQFFILFYRGGKLQKYSIFCDYLLYSRFSS